MSIKRTLFWTVIQPLCLLATLLLGACCGIELAQWVVEKIHLAPNREDAVSIGIAAVCAAVPTYLVDRFITRRMQLHG